MDASTLHQPIASTSNSLIPSSAAFPSQTPATVVGNAGSPAEQYDAVAGPSSSSTAITSTPNAAKTTQKKGVGGPPKSKAYANPLASRADEVKYRTKFRQLKGKVKEVEDENAQIQAKILRAKRQIQRLRLERAILYERYEQAKQSGMLDGLIPASSLRPIPQHIHGIPLNTSDLLTNLGGNNIGISPLVLQQPQIPLEYDSNPLDPYGTGGLMIEDPNESMLAALSAHGLDSSALGL